MSQQAPKMPEAARRGWMILLGLAGLITLNGAGWLFIGPEMSVAEMAEGLGVPMAEFEQTRAAILVSRTALQVAVWFMMFGILASIVALTGLRFGLRWAWRATWVLVAAPAGVGISQLVGGGDAFAYAAVALSVVALVGQLLARAGVADHGF